MTAFNKRLRQLRKASSCTQKQIAEAIGTTEQNYQRYERGTQQPTLPVLTSIANHLDVPIDYLTGRGIYKNWEKIIENKDFIIESLEKDLPFVKQVDLRNRTEKQLISLLPLILEDVQFGDGTIDLVIKPFYLD